MFVSVMLYCKPVEQKSAQLFLRSLVFKFLSCTVQFLFSKNDWLCIFLLWATTDCCSVS
jgi:hypothetical protein